MARGTRTSQSIPSSVIPPPTALGALDRVAAEAGRGAPGTCTETNAPMGCPVTRHGRECPFVCTFGHCGWGIRMLGSELMLRVKRIEVAPSTTAQRHEAVATSHRLIQLQRLAGNRAVAAALGPVAQRCGMTPPSACPCEGSDSQATTVARAEEQTTELPAPGEAAEAELSAKLRVISADLRALHAFGMAKADSDGMADTVGDELSRLVDIAAQIEVAAGGEDNDLKASILDAFGPAFLAQTESMALARAREQGENAESMAPQPSVAQRYAAILSSHAIPTGPPVQRQIAETLVLAGSTMVGTAEASAPVAAATGPPGWITDAALLVVGVALIGIGVYMASQGNVADTGIMGEARALIVAGRAADICAALAILMAGTTDSKRKLKIKATQKAMGCRHSRHS
jgi:Bacterial toxin 34